jgi:hypothetical protein
MDEDDGSRCPFFNTARDKRVCVSFSVLEQLSKSVQKQGAAPKFILQYELDSDPFELFYTEKELRARIAELAEKAELKRDSIKVYEIKKVRTVKLGVKITISK